MTLYRPCIHPGCSELIEVTPKRQRCPFHQKEWDRQRNNRPERKYLREGRYRKMLNPKGRVCALQYEGICTYWATTVDHIVPISVGGTDDPSNLQPACRECNSAKASRMSKHEHAWNLDGSCAYSSCTARSTDYEAL